MHIAHVSISDLDTDPSRKLYLLVFRDVTKLIKDQENLRRYADKLKIANQTKLKLFQIISHDLRGPIGNLKQMLSLIVSKPESFSHSELLSIMKVMYDSSIRIYELLENLLYWSKGQLDKIRYMPSIFDIAEVVYEVVDAVMDMAKRKNIELVNQLKDKQLYVRADRDMVKIIIRNLLTNAIKFTPEGGKITVLYFVDNVKNQVIIGVRDTGIGISEEKINEIFSEDKFVSTVGTKGERGSGLGLKVIREFIDIMGSKFWVESKVGKGSTFYFVIQKV